MKLVLAAIHIKPSPRAVPLGPAMLAAVLQRAFGEEIQTRILNLFLDQPAVECADRILESDPDHVGFSMYVWNRDLALEIASILKQRRPGLVIFAGGAEATADQVGVLGDPAMDFVLPGEGEDLIVETLGRLLKGATPQEIAASARPMPVKDLATLPSPYLDGTLRPADYGGALWELSRGCPFTCDFCFESRGTAGIRRVPMDRVEAELDLFAASGIREVFVLDPTFNYHKANAKQVLRLIAAKAPDIHFFFEIRSEFIDREMAGLFAAIRCSLQIGLQSAHDEVLRNISRSFDPADFEAKILLLHNAGRHLRLRPHLRVARRLPGRLPRQPGFRHEPRSQSPGHLPPLRPPGHPPGRNRTCSESGIRGVQPLSGDRLADLQPGGHGAGRADRSRLRCPLQPRQGRALVRHHPGSPGNVAIGGV